jgi:hypothetical protein
MFPSWQIEEGVNVGHTHLFWTIGDLYDVIARTDFSLL